MPLKGLRLRRACQCSTEAIHPRNILDKPGIFVPFIGFWDLWIEAFGVVPDVELV